MPRRPCLGCPHGNIAEPGKPRCRSCEQQYQRQRNASRPQYRGTWATHSKQAIAAYRAEHGDVCPGWSRPPHPVTPDQWTCDHDLGPLCRKCNSAKGGSHDRRRAATQRNTATNPRDLSATNTLG